MTLLLTGAYGFLGWHLRCRALAHGVDVRPVPRDRVSDAAWLAAALADCEGVVHCAGANRGAEDDVRETNVLLAEALGQAIERCENRPRVVYANSVQVDTPSSYGEGKRQAAEVLGAACDVSGSPFTSVVLPNLFGEHGRPDYNSFVATFCARLASGTTPQVESDRELALLHVQDAASELLSAVQGAGSREVRPVGRLTTVGETLAQLVRLHRAYIADGTIATIHDSYDRALLNTLRSYLFPTHYPFALTQHSDRRGTLFECARIEGGEGLNFMSTTVPGETRGEHFHLHKFERFVVVAGSAVIRLRRLFQDEVVEFPVSGAEPAFIDMPTMWAHSIENRSSEPTLTYFWVSELFDPSSPDTFPRQVDDREGGPPQC